MALYEIASGEELAALRGMPTLGQTRIYNALGRNTGASDDNFFEKRRKSIDNAIGTTGAALATTGGNLLGAGIAGLTGDGHYYSFVDNKHNDEMQKLLKQGDVSRHNIFTSNGFENQDAYYDAKEKAEKDAFSKIGFDIDDYWNKRADADIAGDKSTVDSLDATYNAAKAQLTGDDAATIAKFDAVQDQLKNMANRNRDAVSEKRAEYKDYVKNNPISQRINQDQGKFAGSAINTLSTAFDVMAPGAGILANSVQGGIEGIADELEQNGLQNFDWNRAGQNALIGATTGAVTGGLNKGVNNVLAKNGGNLFKGGNAITSTLNNLGSQTAAGRIGSTLATGAARGALSGAVGGATGAGLSAAMNGQDVLGSAIEGAQRGFGQGALAGGVMAGAGLAKNSLQDTMQGNQRPETEVYNRLMQQNEPQPEERKLLYHGSPANDIDEFDMSMAGKNTRTGEKAIYFTDDLPTAEEFSYERIPTDSAFVDKKGAKGKVYNRYLDMKNPLDLSKLTDSQIDQLWDYADPRAASLMDKSKFVDTLKQARDAGNDQMIKSQLDLSRLPESGYDGIIAKMYPGENDIREYGVFDSSKIIKPDDQIAMANKQNIRTTTEDSGLYPAFEPGNDRIQQRNKLQSIGEQLQTAAKTQKYSALYDSLDNKTAARAVQTGAPDKLESLGVRPENYLEAAKTSDYINNLMTNLADKSDVKVMVPDMTDRLSLDRMDILMPDNAVKKYNDYVRQIVADGSTPDQYSAGYLLKKSREFGKAAANLRGNTEGIDSLRQALTEAKYTLRDLAAESLANADITSDIANDQVAKGLAKLGANKQIQDYYTQTVDGKAPNVRDYIARSSLFEQARDMGNQIEAEKYTRSASKAPTNPLTRLWVASGLEQPVNTVLKNTVAPVASGITKVAGKAIEGAGNLGAMAKNAISGDTPILTNRTPVDTGNVIDTAYNPATRVYEAIGRTEGLTNAEQARTANYITNAVQESNGGGQPGNTLESLAMPVSTAEGTSVYNSMYGTPSAGSRITSQSGNSYFQATGDYWTDVLARALTSAIEADDVDAFAALYSMYQDAASKLEKQSTASTGNQKITATQQRANAAMNSLNRLSQMTPDLGYNLSGIPVIGGIATLGGNDYEGEAKSLAQQIGYMVSGANIKEEEAYNIGKAYVPQPFDSEQTRKNKLNRAYDIIRQYQNGYAVEDNTSLEA